MRRDAKERIKKRVRRAFALAVSAWLSAQLPIYAQSAEDQARIDYESAKLAFVKGDFRLALSKVESVMQVLGPDPTLLTFAAGAAFENRDVPGARDYAKRAYAAADPMFKESESYQQLIALSARIELEGPAIEKASPEAVLGSAARWTPTYDSLCNNIFYPYSPTYKVRFRQSSKSTGSASLSSQSEHVQTIVAIEEKSVTLHSEWTKWSEGSSLPDPSTSKVACDERGIPIQLPAGWQGRGYQLPADLGVGREWSWEMSSSSAGHEGTYTIDTNFSTRCTTEAAEDVAVAAGNFRTLRVVCRSSTTSETRSAQLPTLNNSSDEAESATHWYAPGVGLVKFVSKRRRADKNGDSDTERTWELVEFVP